VKFLITMNMPSSNGNLVHQLHVLHPSNTLVEFVVKLCQNDFVIVEEFYKRETGYESRGEIAINSNHVGKVKLITGAN